MIQSLSGPVDTRPWWQKLVQNYTLRTFVQSLFTVWAVITFVFFLIRLMPGNPVEIYVNYLMNTENLTYQDAYNRAASQFKFDPDASVVQQYFVYLGQLLRGDMGESITSTGTKVSSQILRYLPWTVFCVGSALLISFLLGMLLGMLAAYFRNTWVDNVISFLASIVSAVPDYIWAILILIIFGVQLKWFNVGDMRGTYDPATPPGFNLPFILSALQHAILPITTYVLGSIGRWVLAMRGSTTSTLGEDYVNIARARGLKQNRIMTAYVGRNAALPLFTLLAISIGFVLGGSVIVEEAFVYKGLGSFLFWSISQRDYTSMQGVLLIITIAVVFSNMLADLLYSRLDPRVRVTGDK
ncbi:MAG: ABC transporter permease [Trueperaceae bacterium]|nr:ABC transporter permease [Trueperaceae bacterium]